MELKIAIAAMAGRPQSSKARRGVGVREARNIVQDNQDGIDRAPLSFAFKGRDKLTSTDKM